MLNLLPTPRTPSPALTTFPKVEKPVPPQLRSGGHFFRTEEQADKAFILLHWLMAPLILPTIRYFYVDDKDKRGEYYVRDLTNFGLGAMIFLLTTYGIALPLLRRFHRLPALSSEATERLPEATKEQHERLQFMALMAGLAVQTFNNGVLAVQFQHWYKRNEAQKDASSAAAAQPLPLNLTA